MNFIHLHWGNMNYIKLHWDARHDGIEDVAWALVGFQRNKKAYV
jgi:hypothetical protein